MKKNQKNLLLEVKKPVRSYIQHVSKVNDFLSLSYETVLTIDTILSFSYITATTHSQ